MSTEIAVEQSNHSMNKFIICTKQEAESCQHIYGFIEIVLSFTSTVENL